MILLQFDKETIAPYITILILYFIVGITKKASKKYEKSSGNSEPL